MTYPMKISKILTETLTETSDKTITESINNAKTYNIKRAYKITFFIKYEKYILSQNSIFHEYLNYLELYDNFWFQNKIDMSIYDKSKFKSNFLLPTDIIRNLTDNYYLKFNVITWDYIDNREIIRKLTVKKELKSLFTVNYNDIKLFKNFTNLDCQTLVLRTECIYDLCEKLNEDYYFQKLCDYSLKHYMTIDNSAFPYNILQICNFIGCIPTVSDTDTKYNNKILLILIYLSVFNIPMPSKIDENSCQWNFTDYEPIIILYNDGIYIEIIYHTVTIKYSNHLEFFKELKIIFDNFEKYESLLSVDVIGRTIEKMENLKIEKFKI